MQQGQNITLKVCGMRDAANIAVIAGLLPDYMGFIFYPKSPRYVGEHFKMPSLPSSIRKVGVFVNAGVDEIIRLRDKHGLDVAQLHGDESPSEVRELKKAGVKIFKAFSIGDQFDFEQTKAYGEHVDYFLFDTKGEYYGGNARRFDWRVLEAYDQDVPFLLSGGLTLESLDDLGSLDGMNVHGIDVNSGVETAPAIKDEDKVAAICGALKKINQEQKRN